MFKPLFYVSADEIGDIQNEIEKLSKDLEASVNATTPLEKELKSLEARINSAKAGIAKAKNEAAALAVSISEREEALVYHYQIFSNRVAESYKRARTFNPLSLFLSSQSANQLTKDLAYQESARAQDDRLIRSISEEIGKLSEDKQKLESDQVRLAALSEQLDEQADFFKGEVAKAKTYQSELSGKIATLSAKQQAIISGRQASLNLPSSLGAGPLSCVDDRKIDPGFGSGFAFFTYGIPHRVGLNQYGAYGRAKDGQNYDQILRAYFNFNEYRDGVSATIKVNDSNAINKGNIIWSGSLEDYMKRIYEVPSSWPIEALKAQAVAARSYVLALTDNGNNSICANQYCQVFKTDPKGGDWDNAVSDTSGKVMIADGKIIKGWFASTSGGYTFNSGDVWSSSTSYTKRLRDTNGDVNSFSDLNERSYDKDSPCFYSAQGYRTQYNKSAWLKPSEVADIANVILLARADSSLGDHFCQTDKTNPKCGETWNEEKVKTELSNKRISYFSNVSSISVSADFSVGRTTTVTISGDGKSESFSGDEFKGWFNLRAPANIQIVGPLFNIEKR
ncbi:SpoIID/LytB domain-containing protein [Patescibacteria group bacterium]|nr:SpoIID/LytB domain-containing protein [Patescibacteria group bacterium]